MKPIRLLAAAALMTACHHPIRDRVGIPAPAQEPRAAETQAIATARAPNELEAPKNRRAAEREQPVLPDGDAEDRRASRLQDIFYDYNRSDLNDVGVRTLRADAAILKSILEDFPEAKIRIEGHCDERGSAEYNLALGDRRAARTAEELRALGVTTSKLETVSYGKENPQCAEATESCWQRNRRAHFVISR